MAGEGERRQKPAGDGGGLPLDPKIVLEFLGAAAGLTAFVALVGGALMWLRLDELGLAADRAVALLPRSLLVTLGAQALIVPAVAGLVAVIALYALHELTRWVVVVIAFVGAVTTVMSVWDAFAALHLSWDDLLLPVLVALMAGTGAAVWANQRCEYILDRERGLPPNVLTLAVIGIAAVASIGGLLDLRVWPHLLIVFGVAIVGGAAIVATQNAARGQRPVSWIVFVTFLLVGAAFALVRTADEPKLEPVGVLLEDPAQELAGFYVGEADGRIHIAQLRIGSGLGVSAEPVEDVVSVSRDRVVRVGLRPPAGLGLDDGGRDEAETVLADLRVERDPAEAELKPVDPIEAEDPVPVFAPVVSLHSKETVWPTPVGYFLRNSELRWSVLGGCGRKFDTVEDLDLSKPENWERIRTEAHASGCSKRGTLYRGSDYTRPKASGRRFPDGRPPLRGREGFVLDLDDRRQTSAKLETVSQGQQKLVKKVPVYWEMHRESELADAADAPPTDMRITYWFFYPFSIPPGGNEKIAHEGDWERVSVLVRREDGGRAWTPLSVRFHEHDTHVDVPWADVRKVADEKGRITHPRAYVARGSHATYRRAGRHVQLFNAGGVEVAKVEDDARACPQCPLWLTWRELIPAQGRSWYGFGGAWGEVRDFEGGTGPLGPSSKKTLDRVEPAGIATEPAEVEEDG